jgi:hypothetical protein
MGFENDDDITDEPGADVSKRLRLTPLADASNPIMAQVRIIAFYPDMVAVRVLLNSIQFAWAIGAKMVMVFANAWLGATIFLSFNL